MKAFSVLLALNFQTVALFLFALEGARWLEKNYPKETQPSWMVICFILMAVVCAANWLMTIRWIILKDKSKSRHEEDA